MNMNVPGFTTAALLEFHSKITECLTKDDESDSAAKDYGVRQFADWKQLADVIEAELSIQEVPFTKLSW